MAHEPPSDVFERETTFHDRQASDEAAENTNAFAAFESVTAQENRFILSLLGDLKGKTILDVGAGHGEASLYFAAKGAVVTAVDISPQMLELAQQSASRMGVKITTVATPAETMPVPQGAFDVVYVANTMHHVADKQVFLQNVHAALKPGGLFIAWDPIKYNPLINIYRRMATKVRTVDEQPLGFSDLRLSRQFFPNLRHREFWLLTLALFLKYYLINRYNPNEVRYWRRILNETDRSIGWWFRPLQCLDRLLLALPLIRALAWNTVQWGNKPL